MLGLSVPSSLPSVDDLRSPEPGDPLTSDWTGTSLGFDVGTVRLDDERSPLSNQREFPFCVTNAVCDALEILLPVPVQLSRMYVHFFARQKVGKERESVGTSIGRALGIVSEHGVCAEEEWPYVESNWDHRPKLRAMQAADANRDIEYRAIGLDNRVTQMRACLESGYPLVIATEIDDFFRYYGGGNPLPPPKGPMVGAHAMLCVGYRKGFFLLRNSWGTGWGDGGYAWVEEAWVLDWFEVWVVRKSLDRVVRG